MIKRFFNYINESKSIDLAYYCFDWDDNLLFMPSVIHMDKLVDGEWVPTDLSTSDFAKFRSDTENWRITNNDPSIAFSEFRDYGPRGDMAFLDDAKLAISTGRFAPSWHKFIECLTSGSIFAIITARGHKPENIKMAVEYIIDNVLSEDEKYDLYANCMKFAYLFGLDCDSFDRIPKGSISKTELVQGYLNECDFFGVSSDYFIKKFGLGDSSNPEEGKELAIKFFTRKISLFGEKIGANSVSVGFSDDDVRNVNHIEKIFRNELSLTYAIKYNIYDTSKRDIKGGVRKKIGSLYSENKSYGTEGSVVPFTKWNNMTQKLYPSSIDDPKDDQHNQFKNDINQLKDLTKIRKDKVKKKKSN